MLKGNTTLDLCSCIYLTVLRSSPLPKLKLTVICQELLQGPQNNPVPDSLSVGTLSHHAQLGVGKLLNRLPRRIRVLVFSTPCLPIHTPGLPRHSKRCSTEFTAISIDMATLPPECSSKATLYPDINTETTSEDCLLV